MKNTFFTLYPAIDIKDGKCVRLLFGDMEKETVYNNNPLDQALWFLDQGAEWLHIVDLDGAVTGKNVNKRAIKKILHKLKNKVKIQIGGGIRNIDDLPENAKNYIFAVEDFIGAKISSISTSPEREDTILIENPFEI